ncbi:MAG: EAL domain-containing protein [Spirochaetes bacterium]|nr:EAL domain-containing protein [Spirochaetota bacterium]
MKQHIFFHNLFGRIPAVRTKSRSSKSGVADSVETESSKLQLILAANIFDTIIEGICITDANGTIVSVNRAFTEITGYTAEEAIGQNPRVLKSDRHYPSFYTEMWQSIINQKLWSGEVWNRRKNGTVYPEWLRIAAVSSVQGEISHFVAVFRDLSEIKNRDDAINRLAFHDALTSLPNRVLFADRLSLALRQAEREKDLLSLVYIDINRFKYINTSYGYRIGDNVLQVVADRIVESVRRSDTVARISADDFIVLLPKLDREESAVRSAEHIMENLRRPLLIDGQELYLDASIGISFYPGDGETADSLISAANAAHGKAKDSSAGSIHVYTPALNTRILRRMSLESRLRKAVESRSFVVFYQPRVLASDGRLESAEALVRWIDEDGIIISPAEFIPLAEENGLIIPIGDQVLEQALEDLRHWHGQYPDFSVSVNLSARQFHQVNLQQRIESAVRNAGLPFSCLELEITESLAMTDVNSSVAIMTALSQLGIAFSLDDFGTGYSSLYYLQKLPIQWLKIDQSFVRNIQATDGPSNSIVHTIIEMAKSLGLGTIAEGCENDIQLEFLRQRHCDQIQGYYFSKPVPAAEFSLLLQKQYLP